MAAGLDVPKINPESVTQQTFDAVEASQIELLADQRTRGNYHHNRAQQSCLQPPRRSVRRGTCLSRVKWKSLTHKCIDKANAEYGHGLDALLTEIGQLRKGRPTMVRVTTVYNSVIGDLVDPTWNSPDDIEPSTYAVEKMMHTQCHVAARHGALCADTYHVLNGPDGSKSAQPFLNKADATHLAQAGEDAFAAALIKLGFASIASAAARFGSPESILSASAQSHTPRRLCHEVSLRGTSGWPRAGCMPA